jgi:hypothetical protein
MAAQVWVVLIAFVIQITYSLISASVSKEYRKISFDNKITMGIYYFMTIVALGILMIYGTRCSITGSAYDYNCELLAWCLAIIVALVVLFTIIRSSFMIFGKNFGDDKHFITFKTT